MLGYLDQYKEFRSFVKREYSGDCKPAMAPADGNATQALAEHLGLPREDGGSALAPAEQIEQAQQKLGEELADELLTRLQQVDPRRFERIILDLMEQMHYGAGSLTPISHDGGIDGIIDQDELGLDKIYIQAKRYATANRVQGREMQNFVGSLAIKPVTKGVFVTTSDFSEEARRVARDAQGKNIILIDGRRLAELIIKHNVGVQVRCTILIKKLDEDYFE